VKIDSEFGKTTRKWWYTRGPATDAGPAKVETSAAASTSNRPGLEPASGKDGTEAPAAASPATPPKPVEYDIPVYHMHVVCYHHELKKLFFSDFVADEPNFANSSAKFNQILYSARFLT
jgi:hypothetical protein